MTVRLVPHSTPLFSGLTIPVDQLPEQILKFILYALLLVSGPEPTHKKPERTKGERVGPGRRLANAQLGWRRRSGGPDLYFAAWTYRSYSAAIYVLSAPSAGIYKHLHSTAVRQTLEMATVEPGRCSSLPMPCLCVPRKYIYCTV